MKTINSCIAILLVAGILISNIAIAQKDSNELLSGTNVTNSSFVAEPADKIAIPINEKPLNTLLLSLDKQNKAVRLNYTLPAFTYSATLLIQDFTGRVLKTFNVNLYNAGANEFYINDLLSGTYNYTLVLDHQKKVTGEFIVME